MKKKGNRLREGLIKWKKKEQVTKKEKDIGDTERKKNRDREVRQRQRGRVSNYRTPSVFKAPLLSHPSCG